MSNNNFPVNKDENAILTRGAKPDYTKLHGAADPTPTLDEAGAILEESDTGERFRWTGTRFVAETFPKDYIIEVALGNIPGTDDDRFTGRSLNIGSSVFETLWDEGGDYTFLTADTQLYVSSTSASDTAVILQVSGTDDNFNRKSEVVTLNGQTQVALPGLMFRVNSVLVATSTTPIGKVYVAESDAAPGGVPGVASKIKAVIGLSPNDSGEFASDNISHNGFYTVPAGKRLVSLIYLGTTAKNCDIRADLRVRVDGGAWLSIFTNWAYQSIVPIELINRGFIGEKSDIQVRVLSGNPGGEYEANFQFILVDE